MKRKTSGLTQERLKELVTYDPITGNFVSKVARGTKGKVGDILGTTNSQGYRVLTVDRRTYRAHRLAFLYVEGSIPEVIDHIDTVKHNNSWGNLREASHVQNSHNSKMSSANSTGIKGLSYFRDNDVYQAQVRCKGKNYRKAFACKAWGKDRAKELAINWLRITREQLHGEFVNHG